MDADFSIELGREDPVLDFPWTDPDGRFAYVDVKRHPEALQQLKEVKQFPELGEFLRTVNSALSMVETAKCDAWTTDDLNPEEDVFGAAHKFASYVDMVFVRADQRDSLALHELFAKRLVELLRRAPDTASSSEVCVRRCYYSVRGTILAGCYFAVYVSGYGDDEARSRLNWEIGLKLVAAAILQLSATGLA